MPLNLHTLLHHGPAVQLATTLALTLTTWLNCTELNCWGQHPEPNPTANFVDNGSLWYEDQPPEFQSPRAPQERRGSRGNQRIYRQRVAANWINDHQFWYRNDLAKGEKEFVWVDAKHGLKQAAFDHTAIANALGEGTLASSLPIDRLEYDSDGKLKALHGRGKRFVWDASTGKLTEQEASSESEAASSTRETPNRQSSRTGADSSLTFVNKLPAAIEIFWVNPDRTRVSYGKIDPGQSRDQHTFGGHRWQIVNDEGKSLGEVVAEDLPTEVIVDGRKFETTPPARRRNRDGNRTGGVSPDGKWQATIEDHNLMIKSVDGNQTVKLSQDGREGLSYAQPTWSPDSSYVIAFRVESVEKKDVHIIRSSPKEGGRAILESRPYALPGDPFPKYELNLFEVSTARQIKPEVDRYEHEWTSPRIRFGADGKTVTYQQVDRGHQRFRLIQLELASGSVRNLIDERSDTFIWTAHNENESLSKVNWLDKSNQIIFVTEKNGWRQLILLDSKTGAEIRELTPRGLVVRSVQRIDEEARQVWITASGVPDQDPYFIHYARVDLESGELTWLTAGNGNHTLEYSPSGQYIIDSYSRVDLAPQTELRRVADGGLICKLEEADTTELQASDWRAPEVFVAKGRDGTTDIWGIICRPKSFDPSKKYPVIEDIYAGPQGSFVPKSFSPSQRHESLTSLGFIVVQIDGMGTANRSKAFHDVCWKNLKDGGFQDRILWLQAAAQKYPELDLSRVGIYGTSAGGQNAAAAVLFHPDFYKVAVAACGCHDNRMDKASWNEQWMGYPVGPHYGACSNIDNAERLRGKLLLIVGEVDTNVPPESTLRFADSLIRAGKDFDLLVVPNAGHGMGGAYGQRRMHDYFVRHLLGETPPDRNAK